METEVSKNIASSLIHHSGCLDCHRTRGKTFRTTRNVLNLCRPNSERSLEVSRHLVALKTVIVLQKAVKERNNTNVFVFS